MTIEQILETSVAEKLPALATQKSATPGKTPEAFEKELIQDYASSRANFETIMEMGTEALTKVLEIAEEGQHPRFYEAAALLIKNLSETNREFMEIHVKLSHIRKNQLDVGGETTNINVERGVFLGTTSELQALLNPRKKITTIESEPTT